MASEKNYSTGAAGDLDRTVHIPPNDFHFSDSAKPLRADAIQNREQILQTAHKIFSEKGLSASISEIARQAGVGIGTVYRHFPTKEALFDAVNSSYKQRLTEEAKSFLNHNDPGEAFFDFFSLVMEEGLSNKAVKDAFKLGIFHVRTVTSGVLRDFQSAFADLLTRAQQAKAVREDIGIMDVIAIMYGILMATDEYEGIPDRGRLNRLLSIASEGLRYKITL